jgi:hypothetical protein
MVFKGGEGDEYVGSSGVAKPMSRLSSYVLSQGQRSSQVWTGGGSSERAENWVESETTQKQRL